REEAEAPFRKVRLFFFTAFVGSATVGLGIAALRLLALSQGIDQGQSQGELLSNIGIDMTAIAVNLFLIKNDLAAQDSRLKRMETGAALAALKVRLQLENDDATVPLSSLRRARGREKRVAIVVAGEEALAASLASAAPFSEDLARSDIVIVPLVVRAAADGKVRTRFRLVATTGAESDLAEAVGQAHVALPVILNQWQSWVDAEVTTAVSQGIDPVQDGFALILKKNGRVGTRSKGCPPWNVLCGDVENRRKAGMDVTNI
ncbi:unnamed protein product, partial [Phaeothamnion confervicola]